MSTFLAMGGYARFLWPAYALTFFAIFVNIALAVRAHRAAREEVRRRLAVEALAAEGESQ